MDVFSDTPRHANVRDKINVVLSVYSNLKFSFFIFIYFHPFYCKQQRAVNSKHV